MNMLDSLTIYVDAHKWIGISFIILGIIFVLGMLLCMFMFPKSALTMGIKWACLGAALIMVLGGLFYCNFNKNVGEKGHALFQENTQTFLTTEHERMEKVYSNHWLYQGIFVILLALSIAVIFFIPSDLLKGAAFTLAFFMVAILVIEVYSYKSINQYTNALRTEVEQSKKP